MSVAYQTCAEARVLVHEQRPNQTARGELVMVHGLEGSSDAGYMRSMAQTALEFGFAVHRTNIRGCGGTEAWCRTLYHAGLTHDVLHILRELVKQGRGPVFLTGFSLGGNQVLKLAGELGDEAASLLAGVCAISTPIDLARCVEALDRPVNFLYQRRFVQRMKERMRERHRLMPDVFGAFRAGDLARICTVYEFDNRITAPFFTFGTADRYYATQSSNQYLARIRIPTLLITAKDDPLVPFEVYAHPGVSNPWIRLLASDRGGHVGFLSASAPRFWLDAVVLEWICEVGNKRIAQAAL